MGCINRLNLCPASGDTENVLLQKILQSLNDGGGGSGGGVTSLSINGGAPQTGAVDLTVPDGSLFLLKAGDTGTGPFFFTPTADNVTPLTLSNSITGASAIPTLAINPTWNTTGAPTAFLINATNTASSAAALIFDTQLSGVSVLNLRRDGRLLLVGRASFSDVGGAGHSFSATNALTGSASNAVNIQHTLSAGIPVAGFGTSVNWNLDSTTTVTTLAARLITQWTDPTHATRTSQFVFLTHTGGAFNTALELRDGQVLGTLGSALLPSFGQRSDLDTGMYFPAADTIGFSTAGVARLTLSTTTLVSTVPFLAPDGSQAAPSFSFAADTDTGFYRSAANNVACTTAGIARWVTGTGTFTSTILFHGPAGTASDPTYAFSGDTNTGMYSAFPDVLSLVAGGLDILAVDTLAIAGAVPFRGAVGSAGSPSFSFSTDPNTGIFSVAADTLGFSTSGVVRLTLDTTLFSSTLRVSAPNYDVVGTALTFAATTDIDFALAGYRMLDLTGNVTFTTSNRLANREVVVRVAADGTTRTLTFPAGWRWITAIPASIALNTVGILSLRLESTTDASMIAAWTTP